MRRVLDVVFDLGASSYDLLTRQDLWRQQIARVLDHLPEGATPRRVLDLGCGPGTSAFVLAQHLGHDVEVLGVDLSSRMIARARRNHAELHPTLTQVRFVQADATQLPFADAAFDLIVGHSFLYSVSDRAAVLAQTRRVLAPSGTLVLMEPSRSGSLVVAGLGAVERLPQLVRQPLPAARFLTSMVLWRLVSGAAGRLEPAQVERLYRDAGLEAITITPTLGGLGLHGVGRAPGLAE